MADVPLTAPGWGGVGAAMPEAYGANAPITDPIANLILGAISTAAIPGRAYYSEQPLTSEQLVRPATDLALLSMGGGIGGVEGGGAALGSGPARMRMIDQVDLYKELANQARAKGYATGKSAPGWDFKRPDPAKGSWDRAVAEARAKFAADAHQAQLGYGHVAPGNPLMSADDWAFVDDNIRRGNPALGSGSTDAKGAATVLGLRESAPVDPTQTGWIFKDVSPINKQMARGDWRAVTNATNTGEGIQSVELPIRSLHAGQRTVNSDFAEAAGRRADELPFVIKKNGQYFVQDGHHRITAHAMEGKQTAPVRLLDLDGTTQNDFPLMDYINGKTTTLGAFPIGAISMGALSQPNEQKL